MNHYPDISRHGLIGNLQAAALATNDGTLGTLLMWSIPIPVFLVLSHIGMRLYYQNQRPSKFNS